MQNKEWIEMEIRTKPNFWHEKCPVYYYNLQVNKRYFSEQEQDWKMKNIIAFNQSGDCGYIQTILRHFMQLMY